MDCPSICAQFCSNSDKPVFAIRDLPEEVVAVLFAYYSRSPHSLRENLATLLAEGDIDATPPTAGRQMTTERAKAFHEKWVVGYGHSSVAEHAVVHLAAEQISILAAKALEDCRLASFTEKSTRYVQFGPNSYVTPPEISDTWVEPVYHDACCRLFDLYSKLMPRMQQYAASRTPKPDDWSDERYASVCRSRACDVCRYLLPASTRTNVGITINARALEHMLTKLYSSNMQECRDLAGQLHHEAATVVPTLVKYAAKNDYIANTAREIGDGIAPLMQGPSNEANSIRLCESPQDPVDLLAQAILFEASDWSWCDVGYNVSLGAPDASDLIDRYLARRGPHDATLRALEHVSFTFEVLVDYGAWRDIQRHRICTQTQQPIVPWNGYEVPSELTEIDAVDDYKSAVEEAAIVHSSMAAKFGLDVAQYVLPLCYRKRAIITMNLRELYHFVELRSGREGHRSYRRIAQQCWSEIHRFYPELTAHMRVDLDDYEWARNA